MVKKIITFAVGMILVVAFSAMLISYFNTGKRGAENSMAQVNTILSDNADVMYAQYKQGSTITGAELTQLIKDNQHIAVQVKTNNNGTTTEYAVGPTPALKTNKYDAAYINPTQTFVCTSSTTDGNGIITKLCFEQKR